jgi:hypothetical protein
LVGTENARLGVKVRAKHTTALKIIRFAIQNLLCYGTIRRGPPGFNSPGKSGGLYALREAKNSELLSWQLSPARLGKIAYNLGEP